MGMWYFSFGSMLVVNCTPGGLEELEVLRFGAGWKVGVLSVGRRGGRGCQTVVERKLNKIQGKA